MASMLTPSTVRERNNGLFLVEPATETPPQVSRQVRTVLAVEPASFLTRDAQRTFRAVQYSLRSVRAWHTAVEWVERGDPEVILLDLDALDHALSSINISALRLVSLLRRAAQDRQILLAGVSRRDFCEIEEIARSGLDLLIPHDLPLLRMVQRIDATLMRQHRSTRKVG